MWLGTIYLKRNLDFLGSIWKYATATSSCYWTERSLVGGNVRPRHLRLKRGGISGNTERLLGTTALPPAWRPAGILEGQRAGDNATARLLLHPRLPSCRCDNTRAALPPRKSSCIPAQCSVPRGWQVPRWQVPRWDALPGTPRGATSPPGPSPGGVPARRGPAAALSAPAPPPLAGRLSRALHGAAGGSSGAALANGAARRRSGAEVSSVAAVGPRRGGGGVSPSPSPSPG